MAEIHQIKGGLLICQLITMCLLNLGQLDVNLESQWYRIGGWAIMKSPEIATDFQWVTGLLTPHSCLCRDAWRCYSGVSNFVFVSLQTNTILSSYHHTVIIPFMKVYIPWFLDYFQNFVKNVDIFWGQGCLSKLYSQVAA